jgi:protein SCO1
MRRIPSTIAATVALAFAAGAVAAPPSFDGLTLKSPHAAPDFTLRDQDGRRVQLSRLHGKVVLVTFLYTNCPDVCPLTAVRLNQAVRQMGVDRTRVRVLAISVDPKGDTPRSVARFVRGHGLLPQFRYLVGSRSALAPVWRAYGVRSVATAGAKVDHTLYTLLVDAQGRGRVVYEAAAASAGIRHDLRLLLGTS